MFSIRLRTVSTERISVVVNVVFEAATNALNDMVNVLSDEARYSLFRRKLLDRVEGIVAASVKPLERIQDIRIMQLDGLNGGSHGGERRNATDEVIDSALRYRVQAPMVDSLMADLGIDGGRLSQMGGLIRDARDLHAIAREAERSRPGETAGADAKDEPGATGPNRRGGRPGARPKSGEA